MERKVNLNLAIDPAIDQSLFLGHADRNLKLLRELLDVHLSARNDTLRISGEPAAVSRAAAVIAELQRYLRHHSNVDRDQLVAIVRRTESEIAGDAGGAGPDDNGALDVSARGQLIHAKTEGQKRYLQSIVHNDLVFCEGPAGTGKTFLAVAMAVSLLRRSIIRRIVLVRPAVEAGEKLGFLPGGIEEKVNPYLRPLLDALSDMMTFEQIRRYMSNDIIEVAPLAYMRGRTLNEAVVILDEAQNTTPAQMLMFLTRMGERSKMIVTGDPSQVDLDRGRESGLIDAHRTLRGIKGIAFIKLDKSDIVRHRLVQNIVQAYAERNTPPLG
jgi:phosphate starvation-inducible PhoH-like protein